MKDSSQRESRTLLFVTIAFLVITAKFLLAGVDLSAYGLGKPTDISLIDYATSFTAVLAVWLGREWVRRPSSMDSNLPPGA